MKIQVNSWYSKRRDMVSSESVGRSHQGGYWENDL